MGNNNNKKMVYLSGLERVLKTRLKYKFCEKNLFGVFTIENELMEKFFSLYHNCLCFILVHINVTINFK